MKPMIRSAGLMGEDVTHFRFDRCGTEQFVQQSAEMDASAGGATLQNERRDLRKARHNAASIGHMTMRLEIGAMCRKFFSSFRQM
jgi:hypothetical protein